MAKKGMSYKDAGVDVELGNDASKVLYEAAKETWKNREGRLGEVIVPTDDFSGTRAIDVSNLPSGTIMNKGYDGIGTKIELAERTGYHGSMARDLFAMLCDDAIVKGAEPVLLGSILDVNTLGGEEQTHIDEVKQLARGYIEAASEANVAVVNGEVAELKNRINGFGPFNYNWGGSVTWFANKDRLLTGREIQEGDSLVGLKELGLRSNGLSLFRKVMENAHGEDWHNESYDGNNLGELALQPSIIYTGAVVEMFGGLQDEPKADVSGVAHITGGGIPEKLGRMLKPSGLGAVISEPFNPPELMSYCQQEGNVVDEEAYSTWNMGQGMIIATPDPENVRKVAQEHGIESKIMGEITQQAGIDVKNKGFYSKGEYLSF